MKHEEEDYGKELDLSLWRKLFSYAKPYRRELILLCVCAIGTALADTGFPLVMKLVIDDVVERGAGASLTFYGAIFAGLAVMLSLSVWGFIHFGGKLRFHASHDIRRDGFDNLQRLSFSYYDRRNVGWLMARMTSDCDRLTNILAWGILDLAWGGTLLIGITTAMFLMHAKLALIVVAVVPFVAWVSGIFRKRLLTSARVVRKANSRITAAYNESIMGVRTSKVFVRERENLGEFEELSSGMYGASVRNALLSAAFLPIILSLGSVATGLALVYGGFEVAAGMSVGTLIAFIAYTRQFFDPIQELAHWFAEMQMAQASAERVFGLIDAEPEIRDSDEVRTAIRRVLTAGAPDGVAEDGHPDRLAVIEFRDVGFRYKDGPRVLRNFHLQVTAGETIALVGKTGGGKSTIVSLLCRFYEPTEGSILIDGVDYRRRGLHWWQKNLGIVQQAPHLFSGTIMENIRYGELDADDDAVIEAARLASADDFIRELGNGYLTEVGEGGVMLSTGEKQLVSYARALLARPRILVMDEATSSVDTETERRIQTGLERVLEGRTSFVIAHRLSTIRSADRILVIEDGRIVEEGNHAELVARRGRYHDLYRGQSLDEAIKTVDW